MREVKPTGVIRYVVRRGADKRVLLHDADGNHFHSHPKRLPALPDGMRPALRPEDVSGNPKDMLQHLSQCHGPAGRGPACIRNRGREEGRTPAHPAGRLE
jgi:hypothetical protein